jgi:uncharacterized protein
MSDLEIRTASLGPVEFRAGGKGIGQLTGYAAVFNRNSQNLGGFVEEVDPGAFTQTLRDGGNVMARGNHDDAHLLGTTDAGTLVLEIDDIGLRYTVDLPDTSAGRDFKVLAERGDVRFSSFAFRTIKDDWSQTEQGFPLRTLRSVQLVDVAPVNSPAYLDTSVALRSMSTHQTTEAPAPVDEAVEEPRATHSPVSLRARLLELDAQK